MHEDNSSFKASDNNSFERIQAQINQDSPRAEVPEEPKSPDQKIPPVQQAKPQGTSPLTGAMKKPQFQNAINLNPTEPKRTKTKVNFDIDEDDSLKTSINEDELEEMMQKPQIIESPVQTLSPIKGQPQMSARSHVTLKSALKQPTQHRLEQGSPRRQSPRVSISPRTQVLSSSLKPRVSPLQ